MVLFGGSNVGSLWEEGARPSAKLKRGCETGTFVVFNLWS